MALFLVELRKATQLYGGRKWSNRYFMEAPDSDTALTDGLTLWQQVESEFHYDDCYCYEIYCNQQGDAPFSIGFTAAVPGVSAYGVLVSASAGQKAPTFVVARVDLPVVASRPSRKFYRGPLRETDFDGDTIGGTYVTALTTGLNNLDNFENLRDVDGQNWTTTYVIRGITSRRMGKTSAIDVPSPPSI